MTTLSGQQGVPCPLASHHGCGVHCLW